MLDQRLSERASWIVHVELFDDQGAIIAVDGDLDLATVSQLEAVIAGMIGSGHRRFVIDLTGATLLESTAMQLLVTSLEPLLDEPDGAVALAGGDGAVSRALTARGFGAVVPLFGTRAAAISGVTEP